MLQTHDVDERNKIIGENLRKYRLLKGLTQDELAEGICSISQLSKIENGKTYIKRSLLKEMAERLSVTVERIESMDALEEELSETLHMAKAAMTVKNYETSMELVIDVIQKGQEFGYAEHLIEGILLQCHLLMKQLRCEEVIEIATKALNAELALNASHKVRLLSELGKAHALVGNMLAAYDYFTRADEEFEDEYEDVETQLQIFFEMIRCNFTMKNYRTALRYAEKAEKLATKHSIHLRRIRATYLKADLLGRLGDSEKAEAIFMKALKEAVDNSFLSDVAIINNNIGCMYQHQGNVGQALAHFQRAKKLFELSKEPHYLMETLLHLAEIASQEEDFEEAKSLIDQVFAITEGVGINTYTVKARAKYILGKMRAAQGDFDAYVSNLEDALDIYDQNYVMIEGYDVAVELAESLYQRGDIRALDMYRRAIEYNNKNKQFGLRR